MDYSDYIIIGTNIFYWPTMEILAKEEGKTFQELIDKHIVGRNVKWAKLYHE